MSFQLAGTFEDSKTFLFLPAREQFSYVVISEFSPLIVYQFSNGFQIDWRSTESRYTVFTSGAIEYRLGDGESLEPPQLPKGSEFYFSSDWVSSRNLTPVIADGYYESFYSDSQTLITVGADSFNDFLFDSGIFVDWAAKDDNWKLIFDFSSYHDSTVAVISKASLGLSGDCKAESILFAILLRVMAANLSGFPVQVRQVNTFFSSAKSVRLVVSVYRFVVYKAVAMDLVGYLSSEADQVLEPNDLQS